MTYLNEPIIVNEPLAIRIADLVRKESDRYDQGDWGEDDVCDSPHCIGGWALRCVREPIHARHSNPGDRAGMWLGIASHQERVRLFTSEPNRFWDDITVDGELVADTYWRAPWGALWAEATDAKRFINAGDRATRRLGEVAAQYVEYLACLRAEPELDGF